MAQIGQKTGKIQVYGDIQAGYEHTADKTEKIRHLYYI